MSQESSKWLNLNTLIGFVLKRGKAWHYRAEDQGDESNHYDGAVPVEDVNRRLFHWNAEERDVFVARSNGARENARKIDGTKAIVRSDTGNVLGIFKDGYKPHPYREWLVDYVGQILDDGLAVGSAGLLKLGAVAWVQVEMPDNITTPEGVVFRPTLLAASSLDGSISTTYGRKVQLVVCDNTFSAAMSEKGQQLKIKHTRNSELKLQDAREALEIVHTMADDFAAEVAQLTAIKVTDTQFGRVLDILIPRAEEAGRSQTIADNKRNEIVNLYRADERCAPWSGTAFGVLQTFNTWQHHLATVKGERSRAQRNYERAISNEGARFDTSVLQAVQAATQHELQPVGV